MGLKGRTTFAVAGMHPLLGLVRDYFIRQGLALVPWDTTPDFALIGAEIGREDHPPFAQLELIAMQTQDIPVLLLSSSSVYWYCDKGPRAPFTETQANLYVKGPQKALARPLYALGAEQLLVPRPAPTLAVRPFNVYGPSILQGVVHTFLTRAMQGKYLPIYGAGYQTRAFLYEADFLTGVHALAKRLVGGTGGVYNLGRDEPISLTRLADSVHTSAVPRVRVVKAPYVYSQYRVPNVDKVRKHTGWTSTISLRAGLHGLREQCFSHS